MKTSNTSDRLRELMSERQLKQADIIRLARPLCDELGVKMNRSDISQYVNGKAEPTQGKLFVLSSVLDVNESWLMGYDAPRKRMPDAERFARSAETFNSWHEVFITTEEKIHIDDYKRLSSDYRKRVDDYTRTLLAAQQMELKAAHKRTDIAADSEAELHDQKEMENF